MAYRKAKTRKRRSYRAKSTPKRRTRRMGGVGRKRGSNITRLAGLVAGALAPQLVANIKIKGEPIDGRIVGGASVVVGYFLPQFLKGEFFAGISDGMIASGGVKLLQEFNVLGSIPVIAGWKDMPTISGTGSVQQKLATAARSTPFRPSAAQIMNGLYRGYRD